MNDSIAHGIHIHLYKNQAKLWPHITEPSIEKPDGYDEWCRVHRPRSEPRALHPAELTGKEVVKLYNAIAFAMWQFGLPMNAHATLNWGLMGVTDPESAMKVLGKYNHEVAKWVRRKGPDIYSRGGEHIYVYVHENGGTNGFHTHQLMYVRPAFRRELDIWSRRCLMRAIGVTGIHEKSFHLTARMSPIEETNVSRCWNWFRYIAKQLPDNVAALDRNGGSHSARAVLRLWQFRQMKPLPVPDAVKVSHNIGESAQREAGFISLLRQGKFDRLFFGNEMDEWRRRKAEETYRAKMADMLDGLELG
jgi:hypothetical protein